MQRRLTDDGTERGGFEWLRSVHFWESFALEQIRYGNANVLVSFAIRQTRPSTRAIHMWELGIPHASLPANGIWLIEPTKGKS
jgi:hypothetical protein